jgi:hypothetical protein
VNERFVDYLRAEQELRSRFGNSPALLDSIKALEEYYRVDRESELAYLRKHPEQWQSLLKALRDEK